jgi:uncharacterized protein (UPF0548 family)
VGSISTPTSSICQVAPEVAPATPPLQPDTLTPSIRKRLRRLRNAPVNYDPAALDLAHPPDGWNVDERCQPLAPEPPGDPIPEGSWETAKRLIYGYEFADPSLVRAHYERDAPFDGREMVLELRALGLIKYYVGVRIVEVYDEVREVDGRRARVFGWAYRTLQGHVEEGQMDWMVWKWQDTGVVEFRVHAVSRTAPIRNPIVRLGFALLRGYERRVFLNSTNRRMRVLTLLALAADSSSDAFRDASSELTARHSERSDPAHDRLARRADDHP